MAAVIEDARRRRRRRRLGLAVVVAALCAAGGIVYGFESANSRGTRTATSKPGYTTVEPRPGLRSSFRPSNGRVSRLCWAPAPYVRFSPAPTSDSAWVSDSKAEVRRWLANGPQRAIYALTKLAARRGREVHWLMYALAVLFVLRYAFLPGPPPLE